MPESLAGFVPRRILVCQQRQLGDVLLATPAVSLLRQRFADAEIHFLTERKCYPLLENNPDIDRLWTIDRAAGIAGQLKLCAAIAAQGFDLAVGFQNLPRCQLAVLASRAAVRLGFAGRWHTRHLYTHAAPPPRPGHASTQKIEILAPLGIVADGRQPHLWLTEREKARADDFLDFHGLAGMTLVTVDPTHRRATRKWPAEHYAALLDLAASARPDLRFLLLYGPGERREAEALAGSVRAREAVLVPAMLSLREMAAVIQRAALHLGNCSAPRHIAVAVGTASLTLLGATGEEWTFPGHRHVRAGLDCQPCNANDCSNNLKCLRTLGPAAVLPHLLRLLPPARMGA